MINEVLRVGEDGKVVHEPLESGTKRESKMDEIIDLIDDPTAPLAPIKRLIAAEMAKASQEMVAHSSELDTMAALDTLKLKALEMQVKALSVLGKELMESDILSKKDFLNFDGPRLAYVLQEYRQGAQNTLKKMNIDDATIQQFLRMWRDWAVEAEPNIRKAVSSLNFEDK